MRRRLKTSSSTRPSTGQPCQSQRSATVRAVEGGGGALGCSPHSLRVVSRISYHASERCVLVFSRPHATVDLPLPLVVTNTLNQTPGDIVPTYWATQVMLICLLMFTFTLLPYLTGNLMDALTSTSVYQRKRWVGVWGGGVRLPLLVIA